MDQDEYTIDELGRQTGLLSSTIRLYQSRGILPPPRRQGRVGYYGTGHVSRIGLIGRLQERGYSLAAIAELLRGWDQGRDLDDVLGLERQRIGAPSPVEIRLSGAELAARLPGVEITPMILKQVVDLGLVATDGDMFVVKSPEFLDVGPALVELGLPLDEVLAEAAAVGATTYGVAARFTKLFERHVWQPFAAAGKPADGLADVTAALEKLAPLVERIVQASLRRSLARAGERLVTRKARSRG